MSFIKENCVTSGHYTMMQSVALYESCYPDEDDYVVVDSTVATPNATDPLGSILDVGDQDDDDSSYDYCDDIDDSPNSIPYIGQSITFEDEDDERSSLVCSGEQKILVEVASSMISEIDESEILTPRISSGKQQFCHTFSDMYDQYLQSRQDKDDLLSEIDSVQSRTEKLDDDDDDDSGNNFQREFVDNAQSQEITNKDIVCSHSDETDLPYRNDIESTAHSSKPPEPSGAERSADTEIVDEHYGPSQEKDEQKINVYNHGQAPEVEVKPKSRLTNKKRRKQMKLAKKAAAAAATLAQISTMHPSPPSTLRRGNKVAPTNTARTNKARMLPGSPSNNNNRKKQMATHNVAVSCATQSLALYRNEVLAQKHRNTTKC